MKNSPLASLLLWVAGAAILAGVVLCILYIRSISEIRRLQPQVAAVPQNRAIAQALANDALEYGQKNTNILPLLESMGIPTSRKPAAAAPAGAPTKSSTK